MRGDAHQAATSVAGTLDRLAGRLVRRRRGAPAVALAAQRFTPRLLDAYLAERDGEGELARQLDAAVDAARRTVTSLSSLTATLALEYLERLQAPIPSLTLEAGTETVTRGYLACEAVRFEPARFGAAGPPEPLRLPPLRRGTPPADLLTRVVKASRRGFEPRCPLAPAAWEGLVAALACRLHQGAAAGEALPLAVVDGLARFGWILCEVDACYGLEPERRRGAPGP